MTKFLLAPCLLILFGALISPACVGRRVGSAELLNTNTTATPDSPLFANELLTLADFKQLSGHPGMLARDIMKFTIDYKEAEKPVVFQARYQQ